MLGLLCLCLSVFTQSQAQNTSSQLALAEPKGNGKISGVLTDSLTGKPVEFVTVALLQNGKSVDGTLSDAHGKFSFSRLAKGEYELNFSFIGYQAKTIRQISITEKDPEVVVGNVKLNSAATKLQEVTVVGQKPLIEDKVDRLVYNAEQDISNSGGNAADVLKKVPSLSVDVDGNVQLRGSSNVRVLINNKPSTIMASSVADALKQIPSDMIKSVEVITSPSAKYDAEGSAGIINIITKKNSLEGTNGNVGLSVGTRNSNGWSNLNVRKGKLGVNMSLSRFEFYIPNETSLERTEYTEGGTRVTRQSGKMRMRGGGTYAQLGLDFDLDSMNTFSAGLRINGGNFRGRGSQQTILPDELTNSFTHNRQRRLSKDLNLDYTHIFRPQQELSILTQYSETDLNSSADQDRLNQDEQLFYLQRNANEGMNREITLQTDYTHPFGNKTTLEVGAKTIFRKANSDAAYDITLPLQDQRTLSDNIFHYDQEVWGGYVSYGLPLLKNYNLKAGVRYEQTRIKGNLLSQSKTFEDDYGNFIPNITLSRTLKENHTVKASYTQRIQRPLIFYLNPYRDERDPTFIFVGNPTLDAEVTHAYELGYSTFFKTSSVNVAFYLRQTDNAIQAINRVEGKATIRTFENLAQLTSYGVSVSGSTKPVPKWNINGSLNAYRSRLQSELGSNDAWQYNLNVNSGYEFGKGFTAQVYAGYNAPSVTLQGRNFAWHYTSFSVKKEFLEKKASVTLGINNPLSESINYGSRVSTPAFTQTNNFLNFQRSFRIGFDYKFGQLDASKTTRKKKAIRNDDAKQGEGS